MHSKAIVAALVLAVLAAGCFQQPILPQASTTNPPSSANPAPTTSSPTPTIADATMPAAGQLRVHYVNVGQGDGTIWELPDGTLILYDCGDARSSPETNPMTLYLRDTLKRPFGSKIWAPISSHGHLDHIGGCDEVFDAYEVQHVWETWYTGADALKSYRTFQNQTKD